MTKKTGMSRRTFSGIAGMAGIVGVTGGWSEANRAFTVADAQEIAAVEAGQIEAPKFVQAKPVWAEGREKEMNMTLFFIKGNIRIPKGKATDDCVLRMTGSTIARICVNGEMVGYGPARGPHGWYRVDEWKLGPHLKEDGNWISIEVAGYNSNSYYLLDQPSFLQAELIDGEGNVIVATGTGKDDWFAVEPKIRLQKVQRFSFQRPFIEAYRIAKPSTKRERITLAEQPEVHYLPRRVPYPELASVAPQKYLKSGTCTRRETLENPWRDRSIVDIGPKLKGYPIDELELILSDDVQRLETQLNSDAEPKSPDSPRDVYHAGDVQIVDFGANLCGFFDLDVVCEKSAKIVLTFDEIATEEGDVNFLRLGTCSAIQWEIDTGNLGTQRLSLIAFEPQVGRYAKLHCLDGEFTLKKFQLREYAYPETREATFACSDARLEKLYRAGVLTFRENSVDAFTDCPHRERAGWLCDSFFTARTAFDLTGKTDVEQAFFENYMLPQSFAFLPDGMLPMCYPADHNDGVFIPNWALWFVAELEEYAQRSPDRSTIEGLRERLTKLMAFFEGYENSDGLLEKLPSWVFIEWSKANDFVQDVNYPSNALYAAALDAAGRIYSNDAWREKAKRIRAKIIEQSFDGTFFVDNAMRKEDGSLEITRNRSECGQYFMFFFKTATPESHPELWRTLLDEFGPNRITEGKHPEIHKANSFVGNQLRLELLATAGRAQQLLEESVAYNEYMADRTGTLWENDGTYASCNHGFASHICHVLYRDVVGFAAIDPIGKKISVRFQKFDALDFAEGSHPLPGGESAFLRWEKKDGKLAYTLRVPQGYDVAVTNDSGLEL